MYTDGGMGVPGGRMGEYYAENAIGNWKSAIAPPPPPFGL